MLAWLSRRLLFVFCLVRQLASLVDVRLNHVFKMSLELAGLQQERSNARCASKFGLSFIPITRCVKNLYRHRPVVLQRTPRTLCYENKLLAQRVLWRASL